MTAGVTTPSTETRLQDQQRRPRRRSLGGRKKRWGAGWGADILRRAVLRKERRAKKNTHKQATARPSTMATAAAAAPSSCRRLLLSAGRFLAWREYGDLVNGYPIFFLHGNLNSRLFTPTWERTDADTSAAHARVIAVDRPGYGRSCFDPEKTYAAAAAAAATAGVVVVFPPFFLEQTDRLADGRTAARSGWK